MREASGILKEHLKSKGGRCTNSPGKGSHAFQKFHKVKSTASVLKCLSRKDLVTKKE